MSAFPCQSRRPAISVDTMRFGSDADRRRREDLPLVTGKGRFTDDLVRPGQAHAAFVRAPVGHAILRRVGTEEAARLPGVLAVITGEDLSRDGIGDIPPLAALPGRGGRPMFQAKMPVLARDRVRYVGEPVAVVVAETLAQALDAAEAVSLDFEELPSVTGVEQATAPGAPSLWEGSPDNIALD